VADEPLFNSAERDVIVHHLRDAHSAVVDVAAPGSTHVPERYMAVLDAIADAIREVWESSRA
jgi:hypothetical protein